MAIHSTKDRTHSVELTVVFTRLSLGGRFNFVLQLSVPSLQVQQELVSKMQWWNNSKNLEHKKYLRMLALFDIFSVVAVAILFFSWLRFEFLHFCIQWKSSKFSIKIRCSFLSKYNDGREKIRIEICNFHNLRSYIFDFERLCRFTRGSGSKVHGVGVCRPPGHWHPRNRLCHWLTTVRPTVRPLSSAKAAKHK